MKRLAMIYNKVDVIRAWLVAIDIGEHAPFVNLCEYAGIETFRTRLEVTHFALDIYKSGDEHREEKCLYLKEFKQAWYDLEISE